MLILDFTAHCEIRNLVSNNSNIFTLSLPMQQSLFKHVFWRKTPSQAVPDGIDALPVNSISPCMLFSGNSLILFPMRMTTLLAPLATSKTSNCSHQPTLTTYFSVNFKEFVKVQRREIYQLYGPPHIGDRLTMLRKLF